MKPCRNGHERVRENITHRWIKPQGGRPGRWTMICLVCERDSTKRSRAKESTSYGEARTRCLHGHEWTPGWRRCLTCTRARDVERRPRLDYVDDLTVDLLCAGQYSGYVTINERRAAAYRLLDKGKLSYPEIGARIGISARTVERYRRDRRDHDMAH